MQFKTKVLCNFKTIKIFRNSQEEETNSPDIIETNAKAEGETEDTDPPLDEEKLEENDLSVEEADQIVWDPPKGGSSGAEEKDITD